MSGFQDSFQKGSQTGAQENELLTLDSLSHSLLTESVWDRVMK